MQRLVLLQQSPWYIASMPTAARKPLSSTLVLAVVLALTLFVVYVLSFARVAWWVANHGSREEKGWVGSDALPAYRPVDWLRNETPLRSPLEWWAALWSVDDDLRFGEHVPFDPSPGE